MSKHNIRVASATVLVCFFLCVGLIECTTQIPPKHDESCHSAPRVAVIGGGIAGAATIRFLRTLLGDAAQLTLYERRHELGGRIRVIDTPNGGVLETGASVYHLSNRYLIDFVEELGLQQRPDDGLNGERLGIWDGEQFLFETSQYDAVTMLRGLWRYGLSSLTVQDMVSEVLDKFLRVYDLLEEEHFETPQALLRALDLYELTQRSLQSLLTEEGISPLYAAELITGVNRVNYGQDNSLNALVGLVSIIGNTDELASVSGGNPQIVSGLLNRSGASVELERTVHRISLADPTTATASQPPRYRVHSHESSLSAATFYTADTDEPLRVEGNAERVDHFDAVVMAAPVELSRIAFDPPLNRHVDRTQRTYQVTYVTVLEARLKSSYFGLEPDDLPQLIMTTENERIPFSSLMAWYRVSVRQPEETEQHPQEAGQQRTEEPQRGYKVFSRAPLSDQLLAQLFDNISWVHRSAFHAYPVLTPTPSMPTFRLHDGLFYVNALESAFSTMETEAIGARNVASLVTDYLKCTSVCESSD
mmetsp:Transcript_44532/g.112209  ORF Transcript_44532/g.112209 Transcript_44532/m.112209 type:complete len:533 (+) Transcript_44532:51-1649(+)|eukprot:CAMPEP_0177649678 /NCGR_PEP_ID=MMETSP0447-20121125/11523_1 /TAXON_ID=0 /ORGANISM="Stygamoeba regulata, Strain BSH-02190019" /LENGTH=532 /DNA_ID=CAMNT_0019152469 /DNA_START=26 /DNA_END=1624 /DNA_ORIENTATION=+